MVYWAAGLTGRRRPEAISHRRPSVTPSLRRWQCLAGLVTRRP